MRPILKNVVKYFVPITVGRPVKFMVLWCFIFRVLEIQNDGTIRQLIDPTKDGLYTSRKKRKLETSDENTSGTQGQSVPPPPTDGWTQDLKDLPDFNDINIQYHLKQSGKSSDGKMSKDILRPDKRGYHFFTEKYLHEYLIKKHKGHIYVKAKCHPSQRKNDHPHKLWCAISGIFPYNVVKAACSCVAGLSGSCNHVFALLHQTSHFSKSDTKCVPPEVSKTSLQQAWDKPRVLGLRPESIMGTTVQKSKINDEVKRKPVACTLYEARVEHAQVNNKELMEDVIAKMKDENPLYGFSYMATPDTVGTSTYCKTRLGAQTPVGSVLSYQLALTEGHFSVNFNDENMSNCTEGCNLNLPIVFPSFPVSQVHLSDENINYSEIQTFMDEHSLIIDQQRAAEIEKTTEGQSQCDSWFDERRYRLTASKFGILARRRKSQCDALARNLTSQKRFHLSKSMPTAMRLGIQYEPIAIKKYEQYMKDIGHEVSVNASGLVVCVPAPFLACSPDGKVCDPQCHPHYGLLEVKYPHTYQGITPEEAAVIGDSKFCLEKVNGVIKLKESHMYYAQIQGQLGICGAQWCDFVVYTPKGLHVQRIIFNKMYWLTMFEKLQKFFVAQFVPTVRKLKL